MFNHLEKHQLRGRRRTKVEIREWMVALTAVGSVMAGFIVQMVVRARSSANGDGITREWGLGLASFFLTVIVVWVVSFVLGSWAVEFSLPIN